MKKPIIKLVEKMFADFESPVTVSEGVRFWQKGETRRTNLYCNSQYENLSPEKAREEGVVFYNILNQALRAFERLTDLDRKHHTLTLKDFITQYLAQSGLEEMMDDEKYGKYLNAFIKSRAKYGTTVTRIRKNATKGKRIGLIDYNMVVWDQNDYKQAPVLFKSYMKLNSVLSHKNWDTNDLIVKLKAKKVDTTDVISRIPTVEVYGDLPEHFRTGKIKDSLRTEKQYHVLAYFDNTFYHLYSAKNLDTVISVTRRNAIPNRSAGQSIVEELMEAQVNVNEVKNLAMKELRNITKNVMQTTDDGLDGFDLSELDDMTIVKTAKDTRIDTFPTKQSNFAALENNAYGWINQSKEQGGANAAALGSGEGTREPVGTRGLKVEAIKGVYGYEAENMALDIEEMFKEDGVLDIVYSYFSSDKAMEDLLTKEQLDSFYKKLAGRLEPIFRANATLQEGGNMQEAPEQVQDLIYKMLVEGKISINKGDIILSKKDFIDKVRVNIVGEMQDSEGRKQALQMIAQHYLQTQQPEKAESAIIKLARMSGGSVIDELEGNIKQTGLSEKDPVNNK